MHKLFKSYDDGYSNYLWYVIDTGQGHKYV